MSKHFVTVVSLSALSLSGVNGAHADEAPASSAPPGGAVVTEVATSDIAVSGDTPDTIEITSTRLPRDISQSVSAVTVITQKQIAALKPFDLVDVLNRAPGISVARSGSLGQTTSVRMRGSESDHTLVLIDGVRVNSSSSGQFDFGTIPIENIERIEILRGPQGGLYGSEAVGGVVNLITKRGTGPFATGGTLEFGSQGVNKQVVTAGGEMKQGRLSFSATRLSSNGFGPNDDYKNLGASLRYDHNLSKGSTLTFLTRLDDARLGVAGQRRFGFDPNARAKPRNWTNSLQWNNNAGKRQDTVILGLYDRSYRFNDPRDTPADFFSTSNIQDRTLQVEGRSSWSLGAHTLTVGAEHRREKATYNNTSSFGNTQLNPKRNNTALYGQDEWRKGKFTLVPSVRWEDNQQFGSDFNGRLAAAYDLGNDDRIKASVGTGFHAPTFDFLYFPGFSNPNLRPEKNTGFDIGYARSFKNGGRVEVAAFYNRFRGLINSLPPDFIPFNVDRATSKGLELHLSRPIGKAWTVVFNQTLQSVDAANSNYLLRHPKYANTTDLIYRKDRWNADLALISQGRHFDDDFRFTPGSQTFYPGFTRVDFTLGYNLKPGLELYTRFGNLLNRRYEEIAGYPAPRFNVVFGIKAKAF